jgi:hypothetical protein
MSDFDPNIPGIFQGEVTALTIAEIPPVGVGNLVIDPTQPLTIDVEWETFGFFGIFLPKASAALSGGLWNVKVFAESIGPGDDSELGQISVPVSGEIACSVHSAEPVCGLWKARIVVPAPLPLEENNPPADSGVYKLVATVFLNDASGSRADLIGFREGPVVQVENPA